MKFSDGYWQMRPCVTSYYAVQAHDVEIEPGALVVYAATKRLAHRSDTLNLPLLTVRFSSPMPNVIRVQLYHYKGGLPKKPQFELFPQAHGEVEIHNRPAAAELTSGQLTVRVPKSH